MRIRRPLIGKRLNPSTVTSERHNLDPKRVQNYRRMSMFMYVYVYEYVYEYVYLYVYVYVYVCLFVYVYVYVYVYVSVSVYGYVYMYACACPCPRACVFVCVRVFVCMFVCMCMPVYLYLCMRMHVHVDRHGRVHVLVHVDRHVCVHVFVHVDMHGHMGVIADAIRNVQYSFIYIFISCLDCAADLSVKLDTMYESLIFNTILLSVVEMFNIDNHNYLEFSNGDKSSHFGYTIVFPKKQYVCLTNMFLHIIKCDLT